MGPAIVSAEETATPEVTDKLMLRGGWAYVFGANANVSIGGPALGVGANVDLTTDEFWARMTAPDAPFPTTAAASPGEFKEAFEAAFGQGADALVCVNVSGSLSGTLKSAEVARSMLADREIHVIDSRTASMGVGLLAQLAAELAAEGVSAAEIARLIEERKAQVDLYVALETLEYLKRGGRISAAQAAIGGILSVKPIITIADGVVESVDKPRTRGKARERLLELITARPIERGYVLSANAADAAAFADELTSRAGLPAGSLPVRSIGASVGPHVGPGAYGAVLLYRS
jgi:DegV family protein with EDD domain